MSRLSQLYRPAAAQPPCSSLEQNQFATCLFCDERFTLPSEEGNILKHLFVTHHFIIAEGHVISNLKKYLDFWRIQFESSSNALEKYCTKFKVDIEHECGIEKDVECYMLSDHVEEDKCLRQHLHKEKLEAALTQQQFEREDTSFKRCCLFCRFEETGTRAKYLEHLASDHNLQLGRPDNLVYIDDFLDNIEDKIKNLICIFCERTFKDRNVLREHMRKKGHKRPNPRNRFYNQFYIVNYREMGKTWQDETQINCRHQGYRSDSEDEDGHWSDWEEKEESNIVCLFCPRSAHSDVGIFLHMSAYHNFSFKELTHGLHFYEKVKIVNFIRRKVLDTQCIICDSKAESNSALLVHMEEAKHFRLPEKEVWDQPEFFFPILEDDNLLTYLENDDTDDKIEKTENLPGEICMQIHEQNSKTNSLLDDDGKEYCA